MGKETWTQVQGRFRKKPVEITAHRVPKKADAIGWGIFAVWMQMTCKTEWEVAEGGHGVNIETLEGVMHGSEGDWIIQGVNGELYPCKPDIFAKTYEPA